MTPESWHQIKQILLGWQEQEELESYLDRCCGEDQVLREAVKVYFELDSNPLEDLASLVSCTPELSSLTESAQFLGEGPNGRVFRIIDNPQHGGQSLALKRIPLKRISPLGPPPQLPDLPQFLPLLEVQELEFELVIFSKYLAGPGFDAFCNRYAHQPGQLLLFFRNICELVAGLHCHDLVPGNIKPGNIRFDEQGRLWLLDVPEAIGYLPNPPVKRIFGSQGPTWVISETISPEQLQGEPPCPASDVYALGMLFYRVLCGSFPYSLNEVTSQAARQLVLVEDPPPLSAFFSLIVSEEWNEQNRALARILAQGGFDQFAATALQHDPGKRFASADRMLAALDQLIPAGFLQTQEEPVSGWSDLG